MKKQGIKPLLSPCERSVVVQVGESWIELRHLRIFNRIAPEIKFQTDWNHVLNGKPPHLNDQALITEEVILAKKTKASLTEKTWIADSGSSCHMVCSDEGMYDCFTIKTPVRIGTGKYVEATKMGKLDVKTMQRDGTSVNLTLHEVKFVPDLWTDLFSIGKALMNGWIISKKGVLISLSKK